MGLFDLLLAGSGGVYLIALVWLSIGLRRRIPLSNGHKPSVSIVVAARNEAASIGGCAQALKEQEYEGEFEVIVVDDRSEDDTVERVLEHKFDGLKLVRARSDLQFKCPKKSALAQGIEASSGEVLLFTDADCRPPRTWVGSMANKFAPDTGLVAGYAFPEEGCTWRQDLLALDNIAVGALSAGSMGMGRPLACTGRNLAYRRQVYHEVEGFKSIGHLIGGDDVYFMRLVGERTAWKMVYNREPEAAVACRPGPRSWSEIAQQKLRHAAKAGNYRGMAQVLALWVYLFHLVLAAGLIRMVVEGDWNGLLMGIWGLRFSGDFALLIGFMFLRQERRLLSFLPLLELCYIPYVLMFTVMGRLGWFRWKQ